MKNNLEYEGHLYNDDRMFVLYIARCTEKEVEPGYLEHVIHHTNPPTKNKNPKTIAVIIIYLCIFFSLEFIFNCSKIQIGIDRDTK